MFTYPQAVTYLESFVHYEKTPPPRKTRETFDLEGFRRLLCLLGNPHEGLRAIHVAGTKGKGSTCAMIASILRACGHRVGLYTSPHLISYCERMQINGRNISPERFALHIAKVRKAIGVSRPPISGEFRTTFEILTAAAFLEFADRKVDFAVIETGLGGTLDSTNVVRPLVGVITPVSLDHTELLGKTIAKIAGDKSGIIKPGSIAVTGMQKPAALAEIVRRCKKTGVPCWRLGNAWKLRDVRTGLGGTRWTLTTPTTRYANLRCPLPGRHQAENGSLAVMAVAAVSRKTGCKVPEAAIRKGLRIVRWDGRFQQIKPGVILDGAHNVESARRLAEAFREIFPGKKAVLVLGISREKDVGGILRHLAGISRSVIVTQSSMPRALESKRLATAVQRITGLTIRRIPNPVRALAEAQKEGRPVLVTGSLFLIGDILAARKSNGV